MASVSHHNTACLIHHNTHRTISLRARSFLFLLLFSLAVSLIPSAYYSYLAHHLFYRCCCSLASRAPIDRTACSIFSDHLPCAILPFGCSIASPTIAFVLPPTSLHRNGHLCPPDPDSPPLDRPHEPPEPPRPDTDHRQCKVKEETPPQSATGAGACAAGQPDDGSASAPCSLGRRG